VELATGARFDEDEVDAHLPAGSVKAALQNKIDAEFLAGGVYAVDVIPKDLRSRNHL